MVGARRPLEDYLQVVVVAFLVLVLGAFLVAAGFLAGAFWACAVTAVVQVARAMAKAIRDCFMMCIPSQRSKVRRLWQEKPRQYVSIRIKKAT